MTRSTWKPPVIDVSLSKNFILSNQSNKNLKLKALRKNFKVTPFLINQSVEVHNGHKYVNLEIKPEMIGYTLGEFVFTKKTVIHKTKKSKKK